MSSIPKKVTTRSWQDLLPARQISYIPPSGFASTNTQTIISEALGYLAVRVNAVRNMAPIVPVFYDEFHNGMNPEWKQISTDDPHSTTTFPDLPNGAARLTTAVDYNGNKCSYNFDDVETIRFDKHTTIETRFCPNFFNHQVSMVGFLHSTTDGIYLQYNPSFNQLTLTNTCSIHIYNLGNMTNSYITLDAHDPTIEVGDVLIFENWDTHAGPVSFSANGITRVLSNVGTKVEIDMLLYHDSYPPNTYSQFISSESWATGKIIGKANWFLLSGTTSGVSSVKSFLPAFYHITAAVRTADVGTVTFTSDVVTGQYIPVNGDIVSICHETSYEFNQVAISWAAPYATIRNVTNISGDIYSFDYDITGQTGYVGYGMVPWPKGMGLMVHRNLKAIVNDIDDIEFFVDDISQGSITTAAHIPTVEMQPVMLQETRMYSVSPTSPRSMDVDYIKIYQD